jgi:RND family efflux transporter MFP subunit
MRSAGIRIAIAVGALLVAALVVLMVVRAEDRTNKVALASAPKPVTVVVAKDSSFQSTRTYVGTLQPWVEANVGPQLVAAYVDTVLVRPGAVVKRGDVLATLDCRSSSAASQAVAMQARAIDARQRAIAHEAERIKGLLDGGFVSQNEAEQKAAMSAEQEAQLLAAKSKLAATTLEVNDCILRAPFDGEVATRTIDPGAFVRPGVSIVSVVDRNIVRLAADAPEVDFGYLPPGTKVRVHVYALGRNLTGTIARRAPAADPGTRTVHFEIDISDPKREIPVNTTGEITIDVGEPQAATEVPLYAAAVRGAKATVFVIDGDVARAQTFQVLGEGGGSLFCETGFKPGTQVVTEGRALLQDGDRVNVKLAPLPSAAQAPAAPGSTR